MADRKTTQKVIVNAREVEEIFLHELRVKSYEEAKPILPYSELSTDTYFSKSVLLHGEILLALLYVQSPARPALYIKT